MKLLIDVHSIFFINLSMKIVYLDSLVFKFNCILRNLVFFLFELFSKLFKLGFLLFGQLLESDLEISVFLSKGGKLIFVNFDIMG